MTSNLRLGLHLTSHFGTWSQGLETDEIILSNIKHKVVVNQLGPWQKENNSSFMRSWQLFHLVATLRILTMSLSDPRKNWVNFHYWHLYEFSIHSKEKKILWNTKLCYCKALKWFIGGGRSVLGQHSQDTYIKYAHCNSLLDLVEPCRCLADIPL